MASCVIDLLKTAWMTFQSLNILELTIPTVSHFTEITDLYLGLHYLHMFFWSSATHLPYLAASIKFIQIKFISKIFIKNLILIPNPSIYKEKWHLYLVIVGWSTQLTSAIGIPKPQSARHKVANLSIRKWFTSNGLLLAWSIENSISPSNFLKRSSPLGKSNMRPHMMSLRWCANVHIESTITHSSWFRQGINISAIQEDTRMRSNGSKRWRLNVESA